MMRTFLLNIVIIVFINSLWVNATSYPKIGAEVWIEPGQNQEQIDAWFKTLAEQNMPVARLFIMWNYIEQENGTWDFQLYDWAFEAANKYKVKIEATLTANHGPAFLDTKFWFKEQDGQIPANSKQLDKAKEYIKQVVQRYKDNPALDNWWLMNEPGQHNSSDELALTRFREWLQTRYSSIQTLNSAWLSNYENFENIEYNPVWDNSGGFTRPAPYLDWNWFWRDHMTWYMQWIADIINRYDTKHELHVNPHGIFDILPKYDLPKWDQFLGSLGASIHPSWHFSMFNRNQYALDVSAVCDIIRGAIEPKPFWVSELQGGNNIFSGGQPLCPTPDDISQWVWTSIGSGADKVIFWCLNWRMNGGEAGEWSLLTFQGKPSERIMEASEIAGVIKANENFFKSANPVNPLVSIILSPESMLILSRKDLWRDIDGRRAQAHIKSVMAYYEACLEMGIPVELKQFDDFDWDNANGKLVILANAVSLNKSSIERVKAFVARGNRLLVSGLTGFFDENEHNMLQSGSPLDELLGGAVSEVKLINQDFEISINEPVLKLPAHMWLSELVPAAGKVIGTNVSVPSALRNQYKNGHVLWIPACIGLGSWRTDNGSLSKLLSYEISKLGVEGFLSFDKQYPGVIMKNLTNGKNYLSVIVNQNPDNITVQVDEKKGLNPEIISGSTFGHDVANKKFFLEGNKTLVILWK